MILKLLSRLFKLQNIEDYQCCGNCKYRRSVDMGSFVDESCKHGYITASYERCSKYKFDGLNKHLRNI